MTGADHLAEAIVVAKRALEPFEGNDPIVYMTNTSNIIATFCLHRTASLIRAGSFDVASDLVIMASGYVLGISSELMRDPDARLEGEKAIERVYGAPPPDEPLSPDNKLTADELRELGIEV